MSVLKRKQSVKLVQSDPAGVPTGGFRSAYQIEFPSQGRWGNLRACSGICDVLSSYYCCLKKYRALQNGTADSLGMLKQKADAAMEIKFA